MLKKLKILYQIPSLETVYAGKFIYNGYKDAFIDLGYSFRPLTSKMDSKKVFREYKPDIFITGLGAYSFKFIDLEVIKRCREKGTVMFTQIPTWKRSHNQHEVRDLKSNKKLTTLVQQGLAGDIFFNWIEQEDPLMEGFTKATGYPFQTILVAANKKVYFEDYSEKYKADISFVGNNLPDKRELFQKYLLPLKKKYDVRIYGNDWTFSSQIKGYLQKVGQYFNIEPLKHVRKIVLKENDERKVYSSSIICPNIHDRHQRRLGSDFNERTFKIIASGGFEICDKVSVLRKYFTEKELVIGENDRDWFDKIDFYLRNPEKRLPIIEAGKKKVLREHTYHNRVGQFIDLYNEFSKGQI